MPIPRLMGFPILCAMAAGGCLHQTDAPPYGPVRDLEIATRMEIVEIPDANRDSLLDVFLEVRASHAPENGRYRMLFRYDFGDGEYISRYDSEVYSRDSVAQLSHRFPMETRRLKGRWVRARVSINGSELARDSVFFY
jgi:hypothetical protein